MSSIFQAIYIPMLPVIKKKKWKSKLNTFVLEDKFVTIRSDPHGIMMIYTLLFQLVGQEQPGYRRYMMF